MDYKQLLPSELDKDKDLYLSGEKKPMASYAFREKNLIDFYLNDWEHPLFTLEAEGDIRLFGELILDELKTIAKAWKNEHKTTMP